MKSIWNCQAIEGTNSATQRSINRSITKFPDRFGRTRFSLQPRQLWYKCSKYPSIESLRGSFKNASNLQWFLSWYAFSKTPLSRPLHSDQISITRQFCFIYQGYKLQAFLPYIIQHRILQFLRKNLFIYWSFWFPFLRDKGIDTAARFARLRIEKGSSIYYFFFLLK